MDGCGRGIVVLALRVNLRTAKVHTIDNRPPGKIVPK